MARASPSTSSSNAYLTGLVNTSGTGFPIVNAMQPTPGGNFDAFITKVNPTGTALVYSTYYGGSGLEYPQAIAVDSSGDAYVTGMTASTDFPLANPLEGVHGGGFWDAFVVKLNPSGSADDYATYLGGNGDDRGQGIAVDSAGNAYVAGMTTSGNFPTTNSGPNPPMPAAGTRFVVKKVTDEANHPAGHQQSRQRCRQCRTDADTPRRHRSGGTGNVDTISVHGAPLGCQL